MRKLSILVPTIVGLHACEILLLGSRPAGSLLANSLQVLASWLAAATCIGAYRRGRGLSRPFWLLVGCGMATWGVANLGWMYYENWLNVDVPPTSAVRLIFQLQGVFFAMALFQDEKENSPRIELETLLDLAQIAIVFFFIFLGLYYVPVLHSDPQNAMIREVWIEVGETATLAALAVVRMLRAQTGAVRELYAGLAAYLAIYTVGTAVAESAQSFHQVPTGTWYDLAWTLPLLVGALWAGNWKQQEVSFFSTRVRAKTARQLLVKNLSLSLGPLFAVVAVTQLGSQWRTLSYSLLTLSILLYAVRLGISEFRQWQTAELVGRHTLAMNSALDGISILDPRGKQIYANGAFVGMMGYESPEAMQGMSWRQIYDPGDVLRLEEPVSKAVQRDGRWSGEISIRRHDGVVFPMEMSITLLPQGGTVCVCRDITQRLEAVRARTEAETKYRLLVERVSAVSYIAELGINGRWLYVSPQVETMFGFSAEEWLKDSDGWTRHVHPEDYPAIATAKDASDHGERFQAEYRIVRKDGRVIWVNDTAVVVPHNEHERVMEGIIVDITDRKALENQLQQARRMEAVGRLAGGIAHDFNNLLTIIKGYTELALNRIKGQTEIRGDIERIEDASERAATLVRQLLAFSRKQVLQPKLLDLNAIVLGLDNLLRRLMSENIGMTTLTGEGVGTIKADPGQIEQVIMNLVVNARDAMPNGGRITVETANADLDAAYAREHVSMRPGRYVMLAVTDTGMGMNAETIAHIFEPFYTTKTSGRGTGLGLSTVYGIVKQSGGYIWVYSELDRGSVFKVYLPRVDESPELSGLAQTPAASRRGTETILLVEDEPAVRELTKTVLRAQGYSVLEATSPEDAERICGEGGAKIHLLLTDVIMPGISGRELAKRLTSLHPKMRVLFMSGYTYNVIAQGGMLERGIAFLQKPFSPSALAARVREVLDGVVAAR